MKLGCYPCRKICCSKDKPNPNPQPVATWGVADQHEQQQREHQLDLAVQGGRGERAFYSNIAAVDACMSIESHIEAEPVYADLFPLVEKRPLPDPPTYSSLASRPNVSASKASLTSSSFPAAAPTPTTAITAATSSLSKADSEPCVDPVPEYIPLTDVNPASLALYDAARSSDPNSSFAEIGPVRSAKDIRQHAYLDTSIQVSELSAMDVSRGYFDVELIGPGASGEIVASDVEVEEDDESAAESEHDMDVTTHYCSDESDADQ